MPTWIIPHVSCPGVGGARSERPARVGESQRRRIFWFSCVLVLCLCALVVSRPAVTQGAAAGGWTAGLTHKAGAGSDRLLAFMVGYENGSDDGVSALTYGGQGLSLIDGPVAGTTTVGRIQPWCLEEAGSGERQ